VLDMIDQQIESAVTKYLDDEYGAASFAEFAANRLGIEFEAADFKTGTFEEAAQLTKDRAVRNVPTFLQEATDENLPSDVDEAEWQWQELSRQVNARFELKTTDRDLKRMGRDDLARQLTEQAEAKIQAIDLSDGAKYLQPDWGAKSVADWARQKFLLKLDPAELVGKDEAEIIDLIRRSVRAIYRHKEETFPVQVAVANFMGDRGPAGGRNYDRAGLYAWARYRFPGLAEGLSEEAFRTESKGRLTELLLDVSKKYMPALDQEAIDARLADTFEGAERSEAGDAAELVEWAKTQLKLDV